MVCLGPLLVSLAGFTLTFVAYYPGAMTWDSFVMWGMGWKWPWHDWHSVYIALLMGLSRRLFGDPSALLFLQLLLSWAGLYLAACGLRRRSPAWAVLLPLLGFTPMFLVVSGYLHKTPLQSAVFLFVFGALYFHHTWKKPLSAGWMLFLVLLLLFSIPLRAYGFVCALPLGMLLFQGRRPGAAASMIGGLTGAILLGGASLAVHEVLVYQVLDAQRLHKMQTLYRYDLAALYALTGVDTAPRMVRPRYASHASMQDLYERENGMWRIMYAYEGGIPRGFSVPKDVPERLLTDEDIAYYRAAWLRAVMRSPGTWFRHKVHAFANALGMGVDMLGFRGAEFYGTRQNVFGLRKRRGGVYRSLRNYMQQVEGAWFLKPWLWLVLTASLLLLGSFIYLRATSQRSRLVPILLLLASGGLFYPQLFLTALDSDLRFSHWAMVSAALSFYLFLATVVSPALRWTIASRSP